jgi:hypothetical protein
MNNNELGYRTVGTAKKREDITEAIDQLRYAVSYMPLESMRSALGMLKKAIDRHGKSDTPADIEARQILGLLHTLLRRLPVQD